MSPVPPSLPDNDVPWDRLGRWLAGELTAEEDRHLSAWLAADPRRERLIAELRELWAVTEPGNPSRDPEQVLAAIRQRDASLVRPLPTRHHFDAMPTAGRRLWQRALAAAAIAGLAVGGWWTVRAAQRHEAASAAVALTEHRTGRGQRLTLTLPDGSTVVLGPETTLRYDVAYGRAARLVTLDGEGYFDVTHDETRPFMVRAGNAIARDLGTRFVVRARGDETAVDVAVTHGRVALSGVDRPLSDAVLLDANMVGRVSATGRAVVRRGAPLAPYVGWTEGRLVFDATPLAVVAAELSRWYDVDVRLAAPELAERTLTATFHGEPITKLLPMIQASLGLRLQATGRQYVLSNP